MWSSVMTMPVRAASPELSNIGLSSSSRFGVTPSSRPSSGIAFIALHAGAGFLHPSKHGEIQALLQSAINAALQHGSSIDEAVVIALSVLESSPLTNAALGSCLTEDGRVECEASIVMGNGAMGSVGAATGVDHAIQVAHRLAKERNDDGLIKELGRVRPINLVGEGVYRYAQQRGLAVAPRDQLDGHHTTPQTKAIWAHYKDMIDRNTTKRKQRGDQERSGPWTGEPVTDEGLEPQGGSPSSTPDTVGAIACDYMGRVCAGTSSGGIWMKPAGRLGSSAVPGAGCYAINGDHIYGKGEDNKPTVEASAAASVSGCGEDIMEQFVAMKCCSMMRHSRDVGRHPEASSRDLGHGESTSTNSSTGMHHIMRRLMVKEQVMPASMASTKKRRRNDSGSQDTLVEDGGLATGIIALKALERAPGEALELHFSWAHTAHHFSVAFAAGDDLGQTYEGRACVSTQDKLAVERRTMKIGNFHKALHPPDANSRISVEQ